MSRLALDAKTLYAVWAAFLISLNLVVLLNAYSSNLSNLCCTYPLPAKDFSAYYTALWNLIHDPAKIYASTPLITSEPSFYPTMEQFKYLPSFLILIFPLTTFNYQQAITIFDAAQFLMLPAIAWLLYSLLNEKDKRLPFVVAALVVFFPWPWPSYSISLPYFWLWKEGQTKVLETLLLLCSFYFGKKQRPAISAAFLALSFSDPRLGILGMPAFVGYNATKLRAAIAWSAVILAASNFALIIPGAWSGFLDMVRSNGLTTKPYPYLLMPVLAVGFVSLLNRDELLVPLRSLITAARGLSPAPSPTPAPAP